MSKAKSAILVTGAPRSGTTFLGKMLALPREVGYVMEPLNPAYGLKAAPPTFTYIYPGAPGEMAYRKTVESLLTGRAKFRRLAPKEEANLKQKIGLKLFKSGNNYSYLLAKYDPRVKHYLLKDPMSCLGSEYIHRQFKVPTIILIRHPAAFVASMQRLGWDPSLSALLAQDQLVQKYLKPLQSVKVEKLKYTDQLAWLWVCLNTVLDDFLNQNRKLILVKHETLSGRPAKTIENLYKKLDLKFTPEIKKTILGYTSKDNPVNPTDNEPHVLKRDSRGNIKRWRKHLTASQIESIHKITAPVADKYYNSASWI